MSKLTEDFDRVRALDIKFGLARVPYIGDDIWAGINGKKIFGYGAAMIYAKRLNHAIKFFCVRKDGANGN